MMVDISIIDEVVLIANCMALNSSQLQLKVTPCASAREK
jgi:hypothetical protein